MRQMQIVGLAILVVASMTTGATRAANAADVTSEGAPGEVNACGCYRDDAGACRCQKKGKCACPGECEPVGCDAKREKEAAKAADAEIKRIAVREKKRAAEAAKAKQKSARKTTSKSEPAPPAR